MPPADASLPREHGLRAAVLALRFVAAAAETGDAACYDAAFDGAEAALGPRAGALLVARAAALVRAWGRAGARFRPMPPPCRRLSPDEAALVGALRLPFAAAGLPGPVRDALADLAAPLGRARDGAREQV